MDRKPELVNVTMIRDNLENIPDHPLPEPYSLRLYQPGDERAFNDVWLAADEFGQARTDLFEREFAANIAVVPQRMFFLLDGAGKPVGTATAWFNDSFDGRRYGVVHWVAIVPAEQGKGLAKPLMAAVLKRLKESGHDRAYLVTQTVRLTAINLYLGLGFEPLIRSDEDAENWKGIRSALAKLQRGGKS